MTDQELTPAAAASQEQAATLNTATAPAAAATAPGTAAAGQAAQVPAEVREAVTALAEAARVASRSIAKATGEEKNAALAAIAEKIRGNMPRILQANAEDLRRGQSQGLSQALQDRLALSEERLADLAASLEEVIGFSDPVGVVRRGSTLPNGIRLTQLQVPLGVVGAIYEARPNVTVDIAGLCLKSGNAVILRGGSAAEKTNEVLIELIRAALTASGLDADAVQTVDPYGRAGAQALMQARGLVDVLVPRGGRSLIQNVVQNASVPVIETGEGLVHIYLDEHCATQLATDVVVNSKTQRTSVCNAAETLLWHQGSNAIIEVLAALLDAGVRLHADEATQELLAANTAAEDQVIPATEEDWETEYLDMDLAVRQVADMDQALEHIRQYSTGHTEAILTEDYAHAERFIAEVDSSTVNVNASTRFTDGGQFGLGAEVGISTQKMHARGPMGLAELTTTKWVLRGEGQIR